MDVTHHVGDAPRRARLLAAALRTPFLAE